MATRSGTLPAHRTLRASTVIETTLVLATACLASLAVALLNQPYFEFVNGLANAKGAEARGLLFSSWLLLIGLPIVAVRPRAFGFRIGSIAAHWRLVTGTTVAAAAATAAIILLVLGPTPYSDASLFIETVDVPITEELVFRGVLLTGLIVVLGRIHGPRTGMILAVLIDGVAFGVAHTANATAISPAFVVAQAAFACLIGIGCAALMVRTRSIYPAILLHAVINGVVVAL